MLKKIDTVTVAAALLMLCLSCGRKPEPREVDLGPGFPSDVAPAAEPVEPEFEYELVTTIPSGLEELKGIAVDPDGRVYAAGKGGVKVLDGQGEVLREWATPEPARCLAVDEAGNVYVGLRTRIVQYDSKGEEIASWGEEGRGRGEFSVITGIAVRGPNVLVADAGNRCVHRFDLTGDFIDEIGKRDREAGVLGLICPSPYLDCQIDPEGRVHVNNPGRLRVERYRLDGEPIDHWGAAGTAVDRFCGCCNPVHIALLPGGRTVTAEKGIPRVKVYDADGRMLALIGSDRFSPGADGLDVAVDSKEGLYVADPGDGKIRVFALKQ